jgi:hypothetical protein
LGGDDRRDSIEGVMEEGRKKQIRCGDDRQKCKNRYGSKSRSFAALKDDN